MSFEEGSQHQTKKSSSSGSSGVGGGLRSAGPLRVVSSTPHHRAVPTAISNTTTTPTAATKQTSSPPLSYSIPNTATATAGSAVGAAGGASGGAGTPPIRPLVTATTTTTTTGTTTTTVRKTTTNTGETAAAATTASSNPSSSSSSSSSSYNRLTIPQPIVSNATNTSTSTSTTSASSTTIANRRRAFADQQATRTRLSSPKSTPRTYKNNSNNKPMTKMDIEADAFLSVRRMDLLTTINSNDDDDDDDPNGKDDGVPMGDNNSNDNDDGGGRSLYGIFPATNDDHREDLPKLRPPPFPTPNEIQHQHHQQQQQQDTHTRTRSTSTTNTHTALLELREYQKRRAWLEVLHRGFELLTLSSSPYEPFYAALLHSTPMPFGLSDPSLPLTGADRALKEEEEKEQEEEKEETETEEEVGVESSTEQPATTTSTTTTKTNEENEHVRILEEFVEVVQLRLKSFIKLSRFDDLQRELHRLSLTVPPPTTTTPTTPLSSSTTTGSVRSSSHKSTTTTTTESYAWTLLRSQRTSLVELVLDATAALQYTTSSSGFSNVSLSMSRPSSSSSSTLGLLRPSVTSTCIDSLQSLYYYSSSSSSSSTSTSSSQQPVLPTCRLRIKCCTYLSNLFLREREFRSALMALEDVLTELETFGNHDTDEEEVCCYDHGHSNSGSSSSSSKRGGSEYNNRVRWIRSMGRIEVYSRQGRTLLQVGALDAAQEIFERSRGEFEVVMNGVFAEKQEEEEEKEAGVREEWKMREIRNVKTRLLIDRGLVAFANQEYGEGEELFREAVKLQRFGDVGNGVGVGGGGEEKGQEGLVPHTSAMIPNLLYVEEDLISPALNNMALCALYTCRMRTAVALFEGLIREDPMKYLTECMVFNLCTLYELGNDHQVSEKKKRLLQFLAKRFMLHDVGSDCFRLAS